MFSNNTLKVLIENQITVVLAFNHVAVIISIKVNLKPLSIIVCQPKERKLLLLPTAAIKLAIVFQMNSC